jgi:hypothetical protein
MVVSFLVSQGAVWRLEGRQEKASSLPVHLYPFRSDLLFPKRRISRDELSQLLQTRLEAD